MYKPDFTEPETKLAYAILLQAFKDYMLCEKLGRVKIKEHGMTFGRLESKRFLTSDWGLELLEEIGIRCTKDDVESFLKKCSLRAKAEQKS